MRKRGYSGLIGKEPGQFRTSKLMCRNDLPSVRKDGTPVGVMLDPVLMAVFMALPVDARCTVNTRSARLKPLRP